MGYSTIANRISINYNTMTSSAINIENISFEGIWSGEAYTTLNEKLKIAINKLWIQNGNLNAFSNAMNLLQTYKNNKELIDSLQIKLNNLSASKDNDIEIENITSQIRNLTNQNNLLRSNIESLLSTIYTISPEIDPISYQINKESPVIDKNELYELYKLFENNQLTKLPDSGKNSLYDYYTEEEVETKLAEIKSQYTGREAAVNCAIAIIEMAAAVGLKLDYDWGGGHNNVVPQDSAVATGVDCSGFASWAINQGSTETFNVRTTAGLINVGEKIDYSQAQQGDILVYRSDGAGHVVLVVENDPEKEVFLVAEAKGSNDGVVLSEKTYKSLQSSAYQARDLTSIYNN